MTRARKSVLALTRSSQAKSYSYGTVFSLGNSIPEVAVILFLGVTTDGDFGRYPYKQVCRVLKGSGYITRHLAPQTNTTI